MADPKPRRAGRAVSSAGASPDTQVIEPIAEATVAIAEPVLAEPAVGEPVEPVAPVIAEPPPETVEPRSPARNDAWAALAETQAALARGIEEFTAEVTGVTRSGVTAGADAAIALLGSRSMAEAVEINAGLVRRQVDAMIESSARLSEICLKALTDASRPVLSRFGNA